MTINVNEILTKNRLIVEIVVSVLLMVGLVYMFGLTVSKDYLLVLLLFIATFTIVHFGCKSLNKRRIIYSLFFALPFAVAFCFGRKILNNDTEIIGLSILDFILIVFLSAVFILMTSSFLAFIDLKRFRPEKKFEQLFKKRSWLLYSFILLICWLPLFLVYFPGLISVDSAVQLRQAIGEGTWSNWHPVLHTFFIAIPVNLGLNMFGDLTAGIALATLFQMILLSIMFGYVIKWVIEKTSKKWLGVVLLTFFAFHPVISCYSITMWKDVFFSATFLLLFIKTYSLLDSFKRNDKIKLKDFCYILFLAILVAFLRNGGLIVVAVLGLTLFVYYKKSRFLIGIGFLCIVGVTLIIQGPIYKSMRIASSPFMESMSVPAQQFGYVSQKNRLTDDEWQSLSRFADIDCLKSNYVSMNADPAKNCFNYDFVEENKAEFVKTWFAFLPNHFSDYLVSHFLHVYSYWFIQSDVWVLDLNHVHDSKWLSAEYTDVSLLGEDVNNVVTKIESKLVYSSWLGWMNNPAVLFWFVYLMFIVYLYQRRFELLVLFVPIFAYMISLILASPVPSIFRYVYSLMLILPIIVIICFIKEKGGKELK